MEKNHRKAADVLAHQVSCSLLCCPCPGRMETGQMPVRPKPFTRPAPPRFKPFTRLMPAHPKPCTRQAPPRSARRLMPGLSLLAGWTRAHRAYPLFPPARVCPLPRHVIHSQRGPFTRVSRTMCTRQGFVLTGTRAMMSTRGIDGHWQWGIRGMEGGRELKGRRHSSGLPRWQSLGSRRRKLGTDDVP